MLQIHHLKKSYNKKTEVLSDIDYEGVPRVPRGV